MKFKLLFVIICTTNALVIKNADTDEIEREKRSPSKGRFRGQTQSQFMSFGNVDEGKAEAEATHHTSRAVVAGKNGMGQAQSQSVGGDCSDCYGSSGLYTHERPDPLISTGRPSGYDNYRPSYGNDGNQIISSIPGTYRPSDGIRETNGGAGGTFTTIPQGYIIGPDGNLVRVGDGSLTQDRQGAVLRPGQMTGGDGQILRPGTDQNRYGDVIGPDGRPSSSLNPGQIYRPSGQRPGEDMINQRPGGDIIAQRPGGDIVHQRPGGDVITQRPGGDIIAQRPEGGIVNQRPGENIRPGGENIITYRPGADLITQRPDSGLINQRPGENIRPGGENINTYRPGGDLITQRPGGVTGTTGDSFKPGANLRPEDSVIRPDGRHDNVLLPGYQILSPGSDLNRGDIPSYPGTPVHSRTSENSYHHSHYSESTHIMTIPSTNHTLVNPSNGLTVLIGTGGPKQNVISTGGTGSSTSTTSGQTQQTVYSKEGGLTVLIGTGGPHQTVHHLPRDSSSEIRGPSILTHPSYPAQQTHTGSSYYPSSTQSSNGPEAQTALTGSYPRTSPQTETYPAGSYPSQTGTSLSGNQPSQIGGYPSQTGGYPAGNQPQQTGTFVTGNQPQQTGGYPSQTGGYPAGTQPQQTGGYPTGNQPLQTGGYPTGGYPSQTGGYPTGNYPSHTGTYVTGTQPSQTGIPTHPSSGLPAHGTVPTGGLLSQGTGVYYPSSENTPSHPSIGQSQGTAGTYQPIQTGTYQTSQAHYPIGGQPVTQTTGGTYITRVPAGVQPTQNGYANTYPGSSVNQGYIPTQGQGGYIGAVPISYPSGGNQQGQYYPQTGQTQYGTPQGGSNVGTQGPIAGGSLTSPGYTDGIGTRIPSEYGVPSVTTQGRPAQSGSGNAVDVNASGEVPNEDDDSFSQAESTIKEGEVVASAQGRKNGGTAKTQVSGSYKDGGSFSASAQTSDSDRAAQAQVQGGTEGAQSSAQGTGGEAQSQSQISVNAKNGATSATSQSGGVKHESQSEVEASEKGGLADAQASGPGHTSSQAQIGFKPQDEADVHDNHIFNGGGQASASSSKYSGQSQSQINGKFKFGISYHGAAQSASGKKDHVEKYRDQNKLIFQKISSLNQASKKTDDSNTSGTRRSSQTATFSTQTTTKPSTYNEENDADYEDDDDEYDEYPEMERESGTIAAKSSKTQHDEEDEQEEVQEIPTTTTKKPSINFKTHNLEKSKLTESKLASKVEKPKNLELIKSITTEKVPVGFVEINEKRIPALSHKEEHHETVHTKILKPKSGSANGKDQLPDSYVSVTKQITGVEDNKNSLPSIPGKNFESTYYTKSSTCGYFTFSCNIVYGSNGRSKICRPKPPTNGKC